MNIHQLLLFENKENLQDLNIGKALLKMLKNVLMNNL